MHKDFDSNRVYCGESLVSKSEKEAVINKIFEDVSPKYDLMNNVMSLGLHHLWKSDFVSLMAKCLMYKTNPRILDMASGTGDIALKYLKKHKEGFVYLSDISSSMLRVAQGKVINANLGRRSTFTACDATKLPYADHSFDLYTITFGLRNVSDIDAALKEAKRVLRPHSYFLCMEFSPVEKTLFSRVVNLYTEKVVPFLGEKVAKNRGAYQYLADSIKTFPNKLTLSHMMEENGMKHVNYFELNFGNVAIHVGQC